MTGPHALSRERNRTIYDEYKTGATCTALAQRYGVTRQRIYQIVREVERKKDYGSNRRRRDVLTHNAKRRYTNFSRLVVFMLRYGHIFDELGKS